MALLSLLDAHLAWGDLPLLDAANLSIEPGERIGIIGRNGTGKSSLLACLAGALRLDHGEIQRTDGLTYYYVSQEPTLPDANTFMRALIQLAQPHTTHHDERDRWRFRARIEEMLHHFQLPADASPKKASGGEIKRAALALAFALDVDILLLDEPTNHLDIVAIETLENLLQQNYRHQRAALVITHDRSFLDNISTRIVELDRGILRSYPGNFSAYENRKKDELNAEELARQRFDKFWAQEEIWIRKGIEARRTRNEGRVRRLEELRRQRAARREQIGSIRMNIDAGNTSGKIVADIQDLGKSFEDRAIVKNLNFTLMRGDRLGLIGPNGVGKSTLIKLILGKEQPDTGLVKLGSNLQIAYFDQLRNQLDLDKTVVETVSPGSEWIEINNEKKHVVAYLGDFLFAPRRMNVPVHNLSGGERNRLLLAKLFALPANLLVLDEPTNDLDIDSLELLEQTLLNYKGTVLLVSHDRRFLDSVVTEVLVANGDGTWQEYIGGYSDWLRQRPRSPKRVVSVKKAPEVSRNKGKNRSKTLKLSFKEQRDLEQIPQTIETLEKEQNRLYTRMSQGDYHLVGVRNMQADNQRLQRLDETILRLMTRWEELENKRVLIEKGQS